MIQALSASCLLSTLGHDTLPTVLAAGGPKSSYRRGARPQSIALGKFSICTAALCVILAGTTGQAGCVKASGCCLLQSGIR